MYLCNTCSHTPLYLMKQIQFLKHCAHLPAFLNTEWWKIHKSCVILNDRTVSKTLILWLLSWNSTLGVVYLCLWISIHIPRRTGPKQMRTRIQSIKPGILDFNSPYYMKVFPHICTRRSAHGLTQRKFSHLQSYEKCQFSTFPALQWTAATFLWSCDSQLWTSVQNGPISSIFGGLWSSKG
jgi:hypothetical protein